MSNADTACVTPVNAAGGRGRAEFRGCSFQSNAGGRGGGALALSRAPVVIADSVFDGNACKGQGGAIYAWADHDGELDMDSVRFSNNRSPQGGAVYASGIAVAMRGARFEANGAPGGEGGAVFLVGSEMTIENALFRGNNALVGGGLHVSANGVLELRNSTLVANDAGRERSVELAAWGVLEAWCAAASAARRQASIAVHRGVSRVLRVSCSCAPGFPV
eukprot:1550096-Rhodomonas_salina.2